MTPTHVLAPCPFCGGKADTWFPVYPISADCDDAVVRCLDCDTEGPSVLCDMADSDAENHWPSACAQAIAAWNARAASPREKALEEGLREAAGVFEATASTLDEGDAARSVFQRAAQDARALLDAKEGG